MSNIQEIKSRINCVDYAQRIGLPIHKSGDRCISPLRLNAKTKTSFIVNSDFWYDFGDNVGGDVIDLCALTQHNGDRKQAIHELAKLTGVNSDSYGDWQKYTQNLNNQIQLWHQNLTDDHRQYLNQRKISDETIDRLKIGAMPDQRISIPYWKNGYICYYISRAFLPNQEPKYKKAKLDDLNENAPWGVHTLNRDNDTLVIAEGAFDALSFEQEGYSVLATMGGHFSKAQLSIVRDICKQFKQVFLCFDNDSAGDSFTFKFSKFLFHNKIPFVVGQLPPKYNDISDYYTDGNILNNLIDTATNGLIGLCSKITDKEEFKHFAYQAARFVGKPELAELFNAAINNGFPPDWFAELKKSCFAPPSEDTITQLITSKYNLKYIEALGFYEYSRGYWQRKNDTEIQSYIGDELGHYRTGSRISSILKLLKSDVITTEVFDQKPLFNFINGTLELTEPYNFRPHDQTDLCSMQASYPYNPTAHSRNWDKFISDISDDDPKRIALLQEIAGYVLFPDCSLQQCFFLLGDGANGKSVFLDVLTNVYDEDSISNIELSGLIEPFQRIQLMSSILNISSETKTDVKGAESIFKQVVVGDRINGCYKNKDFINFRSRAKFIFACNEIISVKDVTYGLERRMCFVKFLNKFVDNPSAENERKKDKDLTSKLLKDLPAIFNWALEGYKILKVCKSFTQTDDSEILMQNFRETINPIVVFISENPIEERITNEDLYDCYRQWCQDAGHMPKSRTAFIRAFKQSMPKNYDEFRTTDKGRTMRGFITKGDTLDVTRNIELL